MHWISDHIFPPDIYDNSGQNDKDKCGLTPFMNACMNGQADVVKSYGFSNRVFKQMWTIPGLGTSWLFYPLGYTFIQH